MPDCEFLIGTAKISAMGGDTKVQNGNSYSKPTPTESRLLGCQGNKLYEITCGADGASYVSSIRQSFMEAMMEKKAIQPFVIPKDYPEENGEDYTTAPQNCVREAVTDGDCNTCKSGAPMKSIGLVAIVALIASLL